jgi:hypothetical protein
MMPGALNGSGRWYKPTQGAVLDQLAGIAMQPFVPASARAVSPR